MSRIQVVYLHLCTLFTAVTGALFAIMKYALTSSDPYAVANHPLQPAALSSHVVISPLLVFALGWVFGDHIWPRFRQDVSSKRRSGIWSMSMIAPMTLSGYLIQISTSDAIRNVMAAAHWITAGLFIAAYIGHLVAKPAGRLLARG